MSKSTSMLPSLAGGSGVAAHALADADLMKVVDAVTLNADRDRKVTLAELKAYFNLEIQPSILTSKDTTRIDMSSGAFNYFEITTLTKGTWLISGSALGSASGSDIGVVTGQVRTSDSVTWTNRGPTNINTGVTGGLVSVSVPPVLVNIPDNGYTYTAAFRVDNSGTGTLTGVYAHILCQRISTESM